MRPGQVSRLAKRIRALTAKQLALKILLLVERVFLVNTLRLRDAFLSTYTMGWEEHRNISFLLPKGQNLNLQPDQVARLKKLCDKYLKHEFDLLGSGWIQIKKNMRCLGFEGQKFIELAGKNPAQKFSFSPNKKAVQSIRKLISQDYIPIDWHIDFKSGYRWNPNSWYKKIKYGDRAGADIKVPWELARLQHLPQLALAYASESEDSIRDQYKREFENQTLDFIASNPPRYGVNWVCTMDVAIRACNLLAAMDIFQSQDAVFEPEFIKIFSNSIYDHRIHILKNLEWSNLFRGNHYLANIVGGLMIERYCLGNGDRNKILNFMSQELIKEMGEQFNPDGSNFEASTAYHQLSAEFITVGVGLLLGLHEVINDIKVEKYKIRNCRPIFYKNIESKVSKNTLHKLEEIISGAKEFSEAIELKNGKIIQIGDNDSGRLFKFCPVVACKSISDMELRYSLEGKSLGIDSEYLFVDNLVYSDLKNFYNGLGGAITEFGSIYISILSSKKFIKYKTTDRNTEILINEKKLLNNHTQEMKYEFTSLRNLKENLKLSVFRNFGLFIWTSDSLYLSVRCGDIGQKGWGGHAHNDQLSVELWIDGIPLICDSGSYIYTASKKIRNQYRSVSSHFAPHFEDCGEPGSFSDDIFKLGDEAQARVLECTLNGFMGFHVGYGFKVFRSVIIEDKSILIKDWHNENNKKLLKIKPINYSEGYGWKSK